jgi:6-phosphogluconolactonase
MEHNMERNTEIDAQHEEVVTDGVVNQAVDKNATLAPTQIIVAEQDEIFRAASHKIADAISRVSAEDSYVTIALCGGRNVAGICQQLVLENLDWSKVHFFLVDERMVDIESEDANYQLLYEHLFHPLLLEAKITDDQIHPFVYTKEDDDFGLGAYEDALKQYKSHFDIVLLSSGEDGHIAALYPNHHSIRNSEQFFIAFNDSPKPPAFRMTSSRKLILASRFAFLLFVGDAKRDAFSKFMREDIELFDCPAKLVNYIGGSVVFTDMKLE